LPIERATPAAAPALTGPFGEIVANDIVPADTAATVAASAS
jgi:hypothetical protein